MASSLAGLECSDLEKINAAVQWHYRSLLDAELDRAERARLYAEAYDTIAALYLEWGFNESGVSPALREVVRRFFRGKDVVEFGCGRAQLARQLSDEMNSYLGIEVSSAYLTGAFDLQGSQKHIQFKRASLLEVDLGENTADVIYSNDVVEHISRSELEVVMQKAFHALRPGGADRDADAESAFRPV